MALFDSFENIKISEETSVQREIDQLLSTRAFYDWQYGVHSLEDIEEKIAHFEPRAHAMVIRREYFS